MKAIILAAGEGTRLRPHTNDRPKCMVEIGGRALIDYQIEVLSAAGIEEIVVVTGYRAAALEALGHPTRHNDRYDRSNMVRSMMCAQDLLSGDADVLVCYSDIVYDSPVIEAIRAAPHALSTVVDTGWRRIWEYRLEDPLADAESLRIAADGTLIELGKRPDAIDEIEAQYIGITKIRADFGPTVREVYASMSDGVFDGKDRDNMYMTSFLQHSIDIGYPLHAVKIDGGWIEVDTVEDLARYERGRNDGGLNAFVRIIAGAR